jgi:hypothetical protein
VRGLESQLPQLFNQWIRLQDIRDPKQVGSDGKTIQGRMQSLVEGTAKDIEKCANVCDAYSKKKLIGM